MIRGRLTYLRPVERKDRDLILKWINDEEVMPYITAHLPYSEAFEEAWIERVSRSEADRVFVINTAEGTPIGTIGLHGINHHDLSAELGVSIFEKSHWGRGYGPDAIVSLLRFVFDEMNFHRVQLFVHEDNQRAKRAYEKCGFVQEGLLRAKHFRGGRYTNSYLMGLLASEFRAKFKD
ncbi:MAG TPA: GNAT family protein [Bacillota bacterium]|jgi:RimJ/RimL family protein N-acetyltransferase